MNPLKHSELKPFRTYKLTYTVHIAVAQLTATPPIINIHSQLDDALAPHDWLLSLSQVDLDEEANT